MNWHPRATVDELRSENHRLRALHNDDQRTIAALEKQVAGLTARISQFEVAHARSARRRRWQKDPADSTTEEEGDPPCP